MRIEHNFKDHQIEKRSKLNYIYQSFKNLDVANISGLHV